MSDLWREIASLTASWHQTKLFAERSLTIHHDALHLIVGIMLLLVAALLLRRPISSWWPWLCVAALTLVNEVADLWTERWPDMGMQFGEGAKDLGLTMLVPTVLLFAARYRPDLFRQGARKRRARRGK